MGLGEMYNYLLVELSVPETREWPLISSLYPILLITLGYLYFVLYAGPHYMRDRSSYKLKTFILFYDLFQILTNAWFVKEYISAGWLSEYNIICTSLSIHPSHAIKLLNLTWWLLFLKLSDYIETCVFVLRKKQNQVSALHVYHHVSIVTLIWYFLKYICDERMTFIALCNCTVHVIMYTYYFIAALSPKLQQMILPIKPFLTKLQMIQFIVLILFGLQIAHPNCKIRHGSFVYAFFFIVNILIYLYLFYDFYKKCYINVPKQKNG